VPVGSPETCCEFEDEVDEAAFAITPGYFQAEIYRRLPPEEVCELVARAAQQS
jgi:predicted phosphoribosyltransferase